MPDEIALARGWFLQAVQMATEVRRRVLASVAVEARPESRHEG
jgi:hypothetical protein